MACIRRVNLDAFWSRARSTVVNHARSVRRTITGVQRLGLPDPCFAEPGPLPPHDHCGFLVAILTVYDSLQPGLYSDTHKQWDTVRKIRTSFSNQWRSAASANSFHLALTDDSGKERKRLDDDPCSSLWFSRWAIGCKRRMGQDWRPDQAVSAHLMLALTRWIERKIVSLTVPSEIIQWTLAGAYFVLCYVLSLRGSEGLLLDVQGLLDHKDPHPTHVIFPLLGKVKGEQHSRQHLLASAHRTKSGIQVASWHSRLVDIVTSMSRTSGPVFVDESGHSQSTTRSMNAKFHEALLGLFAEDPSLFPPNMQSEEAILEGYDVFRSFRRGSSSRAIDQNISEADRYLVNRWKKFEASQGRRPNLPMDQHYAALAHCLTSFLRYTKAM